MHAQSPQPTGQMDFAAAIHPWPGQSALHSCDLVNWRLVNHAIRQVPQPRYAGFD